MKRRSFILLLGGASSGAMSVGTGAFSSVKAERGVEVNVVDDENAYLGLREQTGDEELVQVTNQFAGPLDLTLAAALIESEKSVAVKEMGGKIRVRIGTGGRGNDQSEGGDGDENVATTTIGLGEDISVTVACNRPGTYRLEISFSGEVQGSGTTVEKNKIFDVRSPVEAVQFPGDNGKLKASGNGTVGVTAYYRSNGSVEGVDIGPVMVNKPFGPNNYDEINGAVVAVKVEGIPELFWRSNAEEGSGNKVGREQAAERDGPPE